MPTPFFALNTFNGTTPQVKLFNGTQVSPQGVAFGALDSGSMSGNTITGLIADNGLTTYQVTWQAEADGLNSGDGYSIILEVSS